MNISITGANGFIGKRLLELFPDNDFSLKLLVRKSPEICLNKNIEYINGDLLDLYTLSPLLNKCNILIHCAAEIKIESLMYPINVRATHHLLELAKIQFYESGIKVHWVQLSSVGAYGLGSFNDKSFRYLTESSQHSPDNTYEKTKTLADELILQAGLDGYITYTLLRPSSVFGKGMPNNSLRQLIRMVELRLFFYIGDGEGILNYIHVDDVCNAIIECSFNLKAKNQIFNLSNDCRQDILINSIASICNVPNPSIHINPNILLLPIKILEKLIKLPLTSSRIRALTSKNIYSTAKIENLLNFKSKHSIAETIVDLI